MPPLKLLCLHGHTQSAATFAKRTRALAKKLKHIAELHFIDAPIELPSEALEGEGTPSSEGAESAEAASQPGRTWWRLGSLEGEELERGFRDADSLPYIGLEEALSAVETTWNRAGDFDGILSFSQGAALASIVCYCSAGAAPALSLRPPPRFAIIVSAFLHPRPASLPDYPAAVPLALPTLHVYGMADLFVAHERSAAVAALFEDAELFVHEGGHYVPQQKDQIPVFERFLTRFLRDDNAAGGPVPGRNGVAGAVETSGAAAR
ncbi:unnamed protein product [Phaeothamnion confervicola]